MIVSENANKYTYTLTDADTGENKSFTVKINLRSSLPQNIDSPLDMCISEDSRYNDNSEHPLTSDNTISLSTECLTTLCASAITYSKVATSDINRLIKFTNANN
jgi:hypothetical protein